jgi:hypothetical protein|tara:strand:+ start:538 stop:864 length:327 start_codon:yes stop_codon:yes gene_type:complete
MANTIRIKRSAVGGKVPTTSQISLGELAINTTDGKLYTRKEVSGVASIVEIGAGGGGISGPILQSKQVIDSNVNMTTGYNGLSIGDVEIANGYTVEVPANSTWTVSNL